ncbi:hypothetical protein PSN45_000812 [Yamadazyma tenuis]|uniref:PH domain-like protein n=1 Tax=Candida tenuis (strain ATCC 10573 / BCRC 21748 / CBS 615 / JCM 9827 / NBRC 10315 / NRRL Y-1498 / VKM Y-70) TaxID=590646 RepID=G3BAS7_CANTC|nr:PH domain-like protein [Yamadazyma tenuis ATCC 10573]EGV62101.1 PH domain-like protein [Yamadazyma tenuis ATCC 10573]WEJ93349.1 hypothetical protein PSN45_000812 [Yamadazyma tenuis]
MSSETHTGTKRSLDTGDGDTKRLKPEPGLSTSTDDLESLKQSIKAELLASFEDKFAAIHSELNDLKNKYNSLIKPNPPPLPPRDTSTVATAPTFGAVSKPPVLNRVSENGTPELSKPKHTFGGTSFDFKPAVATPTTSLADENRVTDTPKDKSDGSTNSTPGKHVFGATTSFGNASVLNKMAERKNVFADLPSSASVNAGSASSFGANTKFSNAFRNSTAKKSFLDEEPQKDSEEEPQDGQPSQQYKQVDLEPVKNTTGEEDEKSHFNSLCKLFELDFEHMKDGWKERGLGQIHLNQSIKDPTQVRLVMRSHGLLRVILNSKITKNTETHKGLEASLTPGKFFRFNAVNECGQPVQYLLKFSNEGLRDDLVEKIENLKDQMEK